MADIHSSREGQVAHLDLLLVLGQREEVVLLFPLHAAGLVKWACMIALHLTVVLVCLAAHAVPAWPFKDRNNHSMHVMERAVMLPMHACRAARPHDSQIVSL